MKFQFALRKSFLILLGFSLFLFSSCEKDSQSDDPIINDPADEDPANTSGRFSGHLTCTITGIPSDVGLSSYYSKYINCSGIPVIGAADVPDEAIQIASETIAFMLEGLGSVRSKLISDGNYVALYPEGGSISQLPENFLTGTNNTGNYTWNQNGLKAVASDTASLLCYPEVGYGHTLVHEMAHMIHIGALRLINSGFQSQLVSTFNTATAAGKWNNTYARTNENEYLAEAVTIWYGVNYIGPEGGDGDRNNIGTRTQLQNYDSGIFNLINSNFNSLTDIPGCRKPVISGTTANCPDTVTDIDGNVYEVVNVGPMCWLKENLRASRYNDGTPIPNITNDIEWQNTTTGAWSNYDNNPSNDAIYGKLYNGYVLSNSANICPKGWRVPTIQELQDLVNYAGGDYVSPSLRSPDLWNPPGIPATNSSGFSALPSGVRNPEGWFQEGERRTNFGSSSHPTQDTGKMYSKALFADQERVYTETTLKTIGVPCRCIKE
ncbi:MAG: FISUMP domain-containing protein [Flavobacteriaceae bacterium]